MRKPVIFGLAVVLCLGLLPAGTSLASEFPQTTCYGDRDKAFKCVSVRKTDGARKLRVWISNAWWVIDEARVCVRKVDPVRRKRVCHTYPLLGPSKQGTWPQREGVFGSKVVWRDEYPFRGPGVYRVIWRDPDTGFIGGPLWFRVPRR